MFQTIEHPHLGAFRLIRVIGEGACATVYLGFNQEIKILAAFKIFHNTDDAIQTYKKEVQTMRELSCIFIASFYDSFEYQNMKIIMMEFVDGVTVLEKVNNTGPFDEAHARIFFTELIESLKYLHNEKKVVHRDLKCENIMCDIHGNIKLIDFGFAHQIGSNLMMTACGSSAYVAPELISGQGYTEKVDLWAAGVILFAISIGELPFEAPSTVMLFKKILCSEPCFPMNTNPLLIDLIQNLLKKDPNERISLDKIEDHPWFSQDSRRRSLTMNRTILANSVYSKVEKFNGKDKNELTQRISQVIENTQKMAVIPRFLFSLQQINLPQTEEATTIRAVPQLTLLRKNADLKKIIWTNLVDKNAITERKLATNKYSRKLICKPQPAGQSTGW